jgi:peptidoglycan/xylan/chitin deacetylase (PgdA/CDA1 family)
MAKAARPAFAWPNGRRAAVSLSFDDARPSQIDRGIPLLDAAGVRATFYVSPKRLAERMDGWRGAVRAGHEIGNHTMTHPCSGNFEFSRANALEDYTLQRITQDIFSASEAIERDLGVAPETFAYPCGQMYVGRGAAHASYVPLVARHFIVGRAAFNESGNDPARCDLACAAAMSVDDRGWEEVRPLLERAAAAGAWLILLGHETADAGPQTTRLPVLERLCRWAADEGNGVWLDTVAAIGRHVAAARTPVEE